MAQHVNAILQNGNVMLLPCEQCQTIVVSLQSGQRALCEYCGNLFYKLYQSQTFKDIADLEIHISHARKYRRFLHKLNNFFDVHPDSLASISFPTGFEDSVQIECYANCSGCGHQVVNLDITVTPNNVYTIEQFVGDDINNCLLNNHINDFFFCNKCQDLGCEMIDLASYSSDSDVMSLPDL